jgi:hypothetical protein
MARGTADEYVFVPLVNDVYYEYKDQTLTFTLRKNNTPNNTPIEIKILDNKHITKINKNNNRIDIYNILVLTGYAINENSLGLVQTLDPCDYVKGILVNGKKEPNGEKKQPGQDLSIQEIIFSKDEVMNKLYFIRKFNVNLQNDIKINLITDLKAKLEPVRKTNYRSLKINNNEKEEFKKKIKGIADLYKIPNEDIDNLVEKLSDIINYYSI